MIFSTSNKDEGITTKILLKTEISESLEKYRAEIRFEKTTAENETAMEVRAA